MLREFIRALIREEKAPSEVSMRDMKDAWEVLKDWISVGDGPPAFARLLRNKESFFAARNKIKKIPLSKVKIFHNWNKKVKGKNLNNPIVVVKTSRGYQVLDGQHRVLALKTKGISHVMAAVITPKKKKR